MDKDTGVVPSTWRTKKKNNSQRYSYQRINRRGDSTRRSGRKVQRLGNKGKKTWGVKMPKIKIRIISPWRLLARLRDAYVNIMMNFANKKYIAGMAYGPSGAVPSAPGRKIEPRIFNDAELMYLDYLKRDPAFLRSVLA